MPKMGSPSALLVLDPVHQDDQDKSKLEQRREGLHSKAENNLPVVSQKWDSPPALVIIVKAQNGWV